jgi:glucose-6-phosphate 1-epimerase
MAARRVPPEVDPLQSQTIERTDLFARQGGSVSTVEVSALHSRFGIPGVADIVSGNGDLPKVVISAPDAAGEMYLHGSHVTSWAPQASGEGLYLSPKSLFQDGRAIRGGVPVCFPWFGDKADDPSAPAHGFVRTKTWELQSIESAGKSVIVSMSTESGDDTRKWWPHDFRLTCRTTFGAELKIELIVTNSGTAPFTFEEALHAYFAVGDATAAHVRGLDATRYIDKTDQFTEKMQSGDVGFSAETDRVYLATERDLELLDPAGKRSVGVHKQDSHTTVVWNPWSEKSIALQDLGANEWKHFVCIETTNVGPSAVQLGPGQGHTMAVRVQLAAAKRD